MKWLILPSGGRESPGSAIEEPGDSRPPLGNIRRVRGLVCSAPPLIALILFATLFASCAPTHQSVAAARPDKRCAVLVTATWCDPCKQFKRDVLPELRKTLKVADFGTRAEADLHVADYDAHSTQFAKWTLDGEPINFQLPTLVVFERGKIVAADCSFSDAATVYRALGRGDLLPPSRGSPTPVVSERGGVSPPVLPEPGDSRPPLEDATLFQQLSAILGDEASCTINFPGGRAIAIPDAKATIRLPDSMTAKIGRMSPAHGPAAIVVTFESPRPRAEATRLGIRLGTDVTTITFTPADVTAMTGIGKSFKWKLEEQPWEE